jgi:hypothetical protein
MSEYADGFDDGKGEKFDELMVEIVALREQLKYFSAVVDQQQEMLDRNAEQLAARQAKIDALMFEYCPIEISLEQIARWKKHQVVKEEGK